MIPKEAVEAALEAWCDTPVGGDALMNALEAAAPYLRAQALEDAADVLTWVRPEKSPCESFEACCGSEANCDAMRPSTSVVGEHWLRARAVAERGEG